MKKTYKLLIASIIAASTIGLSSTLAWLVPIAKFTSSDVSIDGTTEGAYYAYGDGSAEKPFGISHQRHLYNLAWLQYLGTYDDQQYYFELADTIDDGVLDMGGWVIPPIGTGEHPFIGNFNGKGNVIDNATISNNFDDFNRHPSVVNKSSFNTNLPKVVGFFGVVGELDNNISYGDYDEQVNEFKDTGLANITVRSNATETLVGAAAGYSNGHIANIAIEGPTIDIAQPNVVAYNGALTQNISDYGVVGYTTKKGEISKIDHEIYGVNVVSDIEFNAASDGNVAGWGGSINMKTIYQRLLKIKTQYATVNSNFAWREGKYFYDGVEDVSQRTYTTDVTMFSGDSTARLLTYNRGVVGNFNYFDRGSSSDRFMYLVGGHDEVHTYYGDPDSGGAYQITDGINYLVYNSANNQFSNTFNRGDATDWIFEPSSDKYYIYTTPDSVNRYYLYNNSGSLGIRNNKTSTGLWTVTISGSTTTINNDNRKLQCNLQTWQLVTMATNVYERIIKAPSANYYISRTGNSGANVTRTNDINEAAIFGLDSNGYVVVVNNPNGIMYLAGYSTSSLRFITNFNASSYYYFTGSTANNTITCARSGYYVRYASNNFTYSRTASGRITDFTNNNVLSLKTIDGLRGEENSHMYYT
ncbi:MAG: hypothetical protein GX813_02010, partial [Erysipelotrichia bacterium]|nr:hypothetical protein [Erysipelotrichia bacterium]